MSLKFLKVESPYFKFEVDNSTPLAKIDFTKDDRYFYFNYCQSSKFFYLGDFVTAEVPGIGITNKELVKIQEFFNIVFFYKLEKSCKALLKFQKGVSFVEYQMDCTELARIINKIYNLVLFADNSDKEICSILEITSAD